MLLVRQVIQHPPVTESLRRKLMENIKVRLLPARDSLNMIRKPVINPIS